MRFLERHQCDEEIFEAGVGMAVLLAQLGQRALGDQAARGDHADAVGHALGDLENMRGHDDGAAGLNALAQQALHMAGGDGVEARQRLVENDEAGIVHQRAGKRHLLAHALGETFAAFVPVRLEPERAQEFLGDRLRNGRRDAPEAGDEFEIFERSELVIDHGLVGDPRHHLLGRNRILERIDAEDRDAAVVGPQQACNHAQSGGLAGTVGADQRIEFTGMDGEIEAIDRQTVKTLR